jgi:hypothetical protein
MMDEGFSKIIEMANELEWNQIVKFAFLNAIYSVKTSSEQFRDMCEILEALLQDELQNIIITDDAGNQFKYSEAAIIEILKQQKRYFANDIERTKNEIARFKFTIFANIIRKQQARNVILVPEKFLRKGGDIDVQSDTDEEKEEKENGGALTPPEQKKEDDKNGI